MASKTRQYHVSPVNLVVSIENEKKNFEAVTSDLGAIFTQYNGNGAAQKENGDL